MSSKWPMSCSQYSITCPCNVLACCRVVTTRGNTPMKTWSGADPTTTSKRETMFSCRSLRRRDISLRDERGMPPEPSPSTSIRRRFRATMRSVLECLARYTIPYVPCPRRFSFRYSPTESPMYAVLSNRHYGQVTPSERLQGSSPSPRVQKKKFRRRNIRHSTKNLRYKDGCPLSPVCSHMAMDAA